MAQVYTLLKLQMGNQFISDRIKSAVTWDILAHMEHKEFDDELAEIIRLNDGAIISDITAYKLFDLQDIMYDIKNAKGIIKSTLNTYFDEMDSLINRSFKIIEDNELDESIKNRMCIHLLSSRSLNQGVYKKRFLKYCKNSKVESIFNRANLDIRFNDYVDSKGNFKASFDKRACLYNNFMRKVRIRERFKENDPIAE
ncbi:MAG: hypothetical protein OEY33_03530 [Bdellovibrionales bacterium]|nr:hypothetical protein [Bdellovibrionales bacterium]